MPTWRTMLGASKTNHAGAAGSTEDLEDGKQKRERWTMGIMNDKETDEVPGSILLLSKVSDHNEPLGLRNAPARTSASSLPSPYPQLERRLSGRSLSARSIIPEKKRTADGKIILEPQPEDTLNDPLNWPTLRRDLALFSLGFYCMVGGGMTPILAAGFNDVASTYNVSIPAVALTTGLYMMGMGLGSVIFSPTAILFGKRPVYLVASLLFLLTGVWCALSPNYPSLLVARIIQGVAVSPVECLPSATIAEIFFLHERAYRLGIYTLLLLGGKNLIPLVSAVIVQALGWRWVFWIVAFVVGFCFCLLFLFVPETFWDRTPRPHKYSKTHGPRMNISRIFSHASHHSKDAITQLDGVVNPQHTTSPLAPSQTTSPLAERRRRRDVHVGFADDDNPSSSEDAVEKLDRRDRVPTYPVLNDGSQDRPNEKAGPTLPILPPASHPEAWKVEPMGLAPPTPELRNLNSPYYANKANETDYFSISATPQPGQTKPEEVSYQTEKPALPPLDTSPQPPPVSRTSTENQEHPFSPVDDLPAGQKYTARYRSQPPKSFVQTLRPWSGRLSHDNWFRVAIRPFILFAYPSVLWSTVVYSLSVGWLIVLSESMSEIYRSRDTYNFTALQTGLVYLSPFIGGILGTVVAGKVSDIIVRWMARMNGGIYEPEFRLVMGIPVAVCTTLGLMGFGWSAEERDRWIVPTIFFGVISFGCTLGSTTAITFCVDSYRQYAGEALVTLNFSKNIFHGLVFSLFFTHWLEDDGPKAVFLACGGIQLVFLLLTIPMYMYGKRARMWTVRKNLMERF